jgi:hypothetical protein
LFNQRFWAPIADGSITVTFRRWRARQVVAGRRYRTPAGFIDVDAIDETTIDAITADDLARAGYASVDALAADLRGGPDTPLYRIEFRFVGGPDPRADLAADAALSGEDVAALTARLERLDRASAWGPWTRATLEVIESHPAVRAGDLAESLGRERAPFKLDVRKLKALGLTISLERGYELSPRGQEYLDRVRTAAGDEVATG